MDEGIFGRFFLSFLKTSFLNRTSRKLEITDIQRWRGEGKKNGPLKQTKIITCF